LGSYLRPTLTHYTQWWLCVSKGLTLKLLRFAHVMYLFPMILTTNSYNICRQYEGIDLSNGKVLCFLWCRNWSLIVQCRVKFVLKKANCLKRIAASGGETCRMQSCIMKYSKWPTSEMIWKWILCEMGWFVRGSA
jgi:hypothetical protein